MIDSGQSQSLTELQAAGRNVEIVNQRRVFIPEVLIDVSQDSVSDGDYERIVWLEVLLVHVAAAVQEGHPGLLTGPVGHSLEQRRPELVTPLREQFLSSLTHGQSENVLEQQVDVEVGGEKFGVLLEILFKISKE